MTQQSRKMWQFLYADMIDFRRPGHLLEERDINT